MDVYAFVTLCMCVWYYCARRLPSYTLHRNAVGWRAGVAVLALSIARCQLAQTQIVSVRKAPTTAVCCHREALCCRCCEVEVGPTFSCIIYVCDEVVRRCVCGLVCLMLKIIQYRYSVHVVDWTSACWCVWCWWMWRFSAPVDSGVIVNSITGITCTCIFSARRMTPLLDKVARKCFVCSQ